MRWGDCVCTYVDCSGVEQRSAPGADGAADKADGGQPVEGARARRRELQAKCADRGEHEADHHACLVHLQDSSFFKQKFLVFNT